MSSCRDEVLQKTMLLLPELSLEDLERVKIAMMEALYDYEVAERCTDVAVIDTENEKLIKGFLSLKRITGGSDKTFGQRLYVLKNFNAFVGKPFKEVDSIDILKWLKQEQTRVCINSSANYLGTIKSFFSFLEQKKTITDNPMDYVPSIKPTEILISSFDEVEVEKLKDACKSEEERAMIALFLGTGIRCAELCNLKWSDVDLDNRIVKIIEGKGRKSRVVRLDKVTKYYLLEHKNNLRHDSIYVFSRMYRKQITQKSPNAVWRTIGQIGERAGVEDVHPHRFRHYFATLKYKRGMDVRKIQLLLGHSSINTTMRYIDADLTSLMDACDQAS